jgi:hypothetical protein
MAVDLPQVQCCRNMETRVLTIFSCGGGFFFWLLLVGGPAIGFCYIIEQLVLMKEDDGSQTPQAYIEARGDGYLADRDA